MNMIDLSTFTKAPAEFLVQVKCPQSAASPFVIIHIVLSVPGALRQSLPQTQLQQKQPQVRRSRESTIHLSLKFLLRLPLVEGNQHRQEQ